MPSFANLRPWFYPLKCEALALAMKTSGLGLGLVLAGLSLGLGLEDLWPWPWPWPGLVLPGLGIGLNTVGLVNITANRKPHPNFRMVPVWMTFSDLFKITIIQRRITWKWYNIQLYLQWPTNRKSYMIYQTAPFSMTLNDPYPQFQGYAILWC